MVDSRRTEPALAAGAALGLLVSTAWALQRTDSALPIEVHSSTAEFDYRNKVTVLRDVNITQGNISVSATEATATGLDFENSEWNFRGNVHIRMPRGQLNADSAIVKFANHEIASARIAGSPAEFEQRLTDPEQLARGRAGRIDYDIARGTVRLTDNAWLTDGSNEISGQTLVYNIRDERVQANPQGQQGQGVNITIRPRNGDTAVDRLKEEAQDKKSSRKQPAGERTSDEEKSGDQPQGKPDDESGP